jgi:Rieske Fe-S protein
MSDERGRGEDRSADELPSVDEVAGLDRFLDELAADRRPASRHVTPQEARERMLAAQLRLTRDGVEEPSPDFLQRLEREVGRAVQGERRERRGFSRGRFLRAAATLAGGAGLGVAGVEGVAAVQDLGRPHELVVAGNERWYPIATIDEVPPGGIKSFSAGGLLGFVLNDGGRFHAVSAICTHMGCRLKPDQGASPAELRCLCHGSRFGRDGSVVHGLARTPLPPIKVQVVKGTIYALGTRDTV